MLDPQDLKACLMDGVPEDMCSWDKVRSAIIDRIVTFWRGTDIGIPGGIIVGALVLTCWIIILAMICHCGWIYGRVKLKIEQAREDPNGPPSYLYALRTQRRQDEEFNGEFGEADGCTQ